MNRLSKLIIVAAVLMGGEGVAVAASPATSLVPPPQAVQVVETSAGKPSPLLAQSDPQEAQEKFGAPPTAAPAPAAPAAPAPGTPGVPAAPGTEPAAPLPQGSVGEGVYLNATEIDIKELIKQISKAAGKNFLLDDQIKGKVTIISESKLTLDEAYQAFLSALSVAGYTTVEGPAGLIKVIPLKEAVQYPISIYKGTSPITDNFVTRVITLGNISALDISNAIKGLVSKDGNLLAYPPTNTLILTDTGSNIDRIMQIIRELDKEGPQQTIEIIPIQFAAAKDITDKLNQLFEATSGQSSKGAGAQPRRTQTGSKGAAGSQEDIPAVSKIITDERTNSVIILGTKRGILDMKEVISKLDTQLASGAEGTIHVHYLQNAVATELASVLASLTSGSAVKKSAAPAGEGKAGAAKEKDTGAPTAEFEGGLKITADENTNALVIVASPKDYQTLVEKVISRLDIPRRQVYLEAIVMELSINKNSSLGLSGQGGGAFSGAGQSLLGFASLFGGTASGLASLGGLAGGLVSQNTVNIPITQQDGTISNISLPAFGLVLNALQSNQNANVLSTPSLLTLDNEEAEILVGSEVPFQTGATVSSTGTTTQVTREDVGIILKITPQINESDAIRLKISQELSNVVQTTVNDPNGPTTTKRSVNTVVVAENQQTIVIGGLLQDNATMAVSKIPLFGDIPLVGNLFKSRARQRSKNNIIIFITPYIIRDRADFLVILKKKVEERNQFIDYNYGKSAQKSIRRDIERHTSNLLDQTTVTQSPFTPYTTPTTPPAPAPIQKEAIPPVKSPAKEVPSSVPPTTQPAKISAEPSPKDTTKTSTPTTTTTPQTPPSTTTSTTSTKTTTSTSSTTTKPPASTTQPSSTTTGTTSTPTTAVPTTDASEWNKQNP